MYEYVIIIFGLTLVVWLLYLWFFIPGRENTILVRVYSFTLYVLLNLSVYYALGELHFGMVLLVTLVMLCIYHRGFLVFVISVCREMYHFMRLWHLFSGFSFCICMSIYMDSPLDMRFCLYSLFFIGLFALSVMVLEVLFITRGVGPGGIYLWVYLIMKHAATLGILFFCWWYGILLYDFYIESEKALDVSYGILSTYAFYLFGAPGYKKEETETYFGYKFEPCHKDYKFFRLLYEMYMNNYLGLFLKGVIKIYHVSVWKRYGFVVLLIIFCILSGISFYQNEFLPIQVGICVLIFLRFVYIFYYLLKFEDSKWFLILITFGIILMVFSFARWLVEYIGLGLHLDIINSHFPDSSHRVSTISIDTSSHFIHDLFYKLFPSKKTLALTHAMANAYIIYKNSNCGVVVAPTLEELHIITKVYLELLSDTRMPIPLYFSEDSVNLHNFLLDNVKYTNKDLSSRLIFAATYLLCDFMIVIGIAAFSCVGLTIFALIMLEVFDWVTSSMM